MINTLFFSLTFVLGIGLVTTALVAFWLWVKFKDSKIELSLVEHTIDGCNFYCLPYFEAVKVLNQFYSQLMNEGLFKGYTVKGITRAKDQNIVHQLHTDGYSLVNHKGEVLLYRDNLLINLYLPNKQVL